MYIRAKEVCMEAVESRVLKTGQIEWRKLSFIQNDDFKEWTTDGDRKLLQSIIKYQFIDPFKVWENNGVLYCLDGKHRYMDLLKVEESGVAVPKNLPATFLDCRDMQEAAELVLVYSSSYARITTDGLAAFAESYKLSIPDLQQLIELPDFNFEAFDTSFTQPQGEPIVPISLADRFIVPPFSILDTRQGYWQERKKAWHSLGFDSQETREDVELVAKSGQAPAIYELRNKMRDQLKRDPTWDEIIAEAEKKGMHVYSGASIFDPVLAEICYKWFVPEGGSVLDPFAGGSVRGIVAGMLGLKYYGIDLRKDQVTANFNQLKLMIESGRSFLNVGWTTGDSNKVLTEMADEDFDFLFSCPPYHDLEQYSDDPADLSNMSYEEFCTVYRSIITKAISKLKPNRFACFVVGDIRAKDGSYRNFVSETIDCFINNQNYTGEPIMLYNEIILVNVAGSLPVRINRQFGGYRKVGKMHQNVLVFYKGDPKKIKDEFPEIVIEDINSKEVEIL